MVGAEVSAQSFKTMRWSQFRRNNASALPHDAAAPTSLTDLKLSARIRCPASSCACVTYYFRQNRMFAAAGTVSPDSVGTPGLCQ
jgi:hypothetical protein